MQPLLAGGDWADAVPAPPDPTVPRPVPPPPRRRYRRRCQASSTSLVQLIEYRPEVMSEALAQATDMVGYWAGLLMFSRFSHPWTFRLARIAIVVGEFVAMNLKRSTSAPGPPSSRRR